MKGKVWAGLTVLIVAVSGLFLACGGRESSDKVLAAKKVGTAPVLDGKLDDSWQLARSFEIPVVVADYSHFAEMYRNKKYDVTLRAMYTDSDLYIFAQWTGDAELSVDRESWYFNSDADKWMQKPKNAPDAYTPPAYEDKFAMLWNINSPDFREKGGSVFCHEAFKHTNSPDEKMDLWHWKLVRTGPVKQLDDTYVVYVDERAGGTNFNGRKSDAGGGAYSDNIQTLTIGDAKVTLPLLWIPGAANYNWIMNGDPKARKIVGMDKDKNLIDEDGSILIKEEFILESKKLIPSIYGVKPATGSRGDVEAFEYYDAASKTWNLEMRRKLVTGYGDDVQFDDIKKMYDFSVAVFDNAAIAHATPEGLTGKAYSMVFN